MKKIIITTIILFIVFLTSCSKYRDTTPDGRIKVVATVGMIGDVAKNIGGEKILVHTLIGAGIDPHTYKTRVSDISKMFQARVILYNGLHLEAKMGDVLKKIGKRNGKTFAVAEIIKKDKLLRLEEKLYDMHVWMDPNLWKIVTKRITEIFIKTIPAHSSYFKKNYNEYVKKLITLDKYIKNRLNSIPKSKRVLITAHDAFAYFGKAYGIKVMGIQGISTQSEASIGQIQKLADYIAKNKIPAIFVESTVPQKTVTALQEAVKSRGYNVKVGGELFADAMGTPGTKEGSYIGMIKYNVDKIVNALKSSISE